MHRNKRLTVTFCLIMLLSAACSSEVVPTRLAIPTTAVAPAIPTTAVPTTPVPTATDLPTRIVSPSLTPTEVRPTATPTLTTSGDWQVPVVSLPAENNYRPSSITSNKPGIISIQDEVNNTFLIDIAAGRITAMITPTPFVPTPTPDDKVIAVSVQAAVQCTPAGLEMVSLPDQRVLAQSALPVGHCSNVAWTQDGSASAFVTDQNEVYLWLPDGSLPKKIGQLSTGSMPFWSPDGTRVLLMDLFPGKQDNQTLYSFSIAYRDGRPMFKPGTPLETGNEWALDVGSLGWLTNNVIYSQKDAMSYYNVDFYDANTGRYLIRTGFADMGHEPWMSPDKHWIVLESAPSQTLWKYRDGGDPDPQQNLSGLMILDLQTLRRSLVIQHLPDDEETCCGSDSLKFLGWKDDGSLFYLIHFPVGRPKYDLPTGFMALYPQIGYLEPLVRNVVFGLLSPDDQHVFLMTADTIEENYATGLKAGMYRLDGTLVSELQPIGDELEYDRLNEWDMYTTLQTSLFPSNWDYQGNQLAFADPLGNI